MKVSFATFFIATQALSALAAPSFVSQYELDGTSRRSGGSLIDRLREDKRFGRFVEVLDKERGLRDELENRDKETTVFAPTDAAFKRMEDEWSSRSGGENKPNMRDILRYHVAGESQISEDCLHAGALIPTNLRLKSLEDRHQRIRVFRFNDNVWLNMRARVVEADIKAENGRIHAIDHVLVPPQSVTEMLYTVPTSFSTTIAALERTGLASELEREKGVTVFSPSNNAWKQLGFENLKYLFSCVGQETEGGRGSSSGGGSGGESRITCRGTKDLKKILQNHVGTSVKYSTDFMEKETTKLRTLGDEEIRVCAKQQRGGKGERDEDERDRYGGDKGEHRDVRRYQLIVNDGEARISFTDGLASNGAVQVINNVIIPRSVRLPHDRFMNMDV